MNRLLALIAFAFFAIFVAILAYEVPSPDLIGVIAFTTALVAFDLVTSTRKKP